MTSYKVHTRRAVPPEQWVVCENAHPPLVSGEEFRQVQNLLGSRRYVGQKAEHPLSGLVFCAGCGARMYPHRVGRYCYFICGTYARDPARCTAHRLREDLLERLVAGQLRTLLQAAADPARLAACLQHQLCPDRPDPARLQAKLDRLEVQRRQAYADRLEGLIGAGEYAAAAARLQRKEEELRRRWQTAGQAPSGPSLDWLTRRVERLLALEQPDRPLLGQLLRGIFVGENGRVELRLAFSGPKGETENSITF